MAGTIVGASGAAALGTSLDTNAAIGAMHSMAQQGVAQTIATAQDQLQLSLAAGLANIMKGVGSNIKSASQGG
ncbi:hypothetical protein [Uliginosibacterium gangwonense]|uniref:hypothetical protein n=1 Tax=Uliginosibacterium gangwonense TaxID=392736 RepID=UPI0003614251|nr:hypothetical protein [Uliginosibacterium gangwonense]